MDELKPKAYVGTKIVLAVPQTKADQQGYRVVYPDGYESWSPKKTFEDAYRLISDEERTLL